MLLSVSSCHAIGPTRRAFRVYYYCAMCFVTWPLVRTRGRHTEYIHVRCYSLARVEGFTGRARLAGNHDVAPAVVATSEMRPFV